MSGTRPRSGRGEREDWLRRPAVERSRPWALEEQLFASGRAPEREQQLADLARRILDERVRIDRLHDEIHERSALLDELERQLAALVRSSSDGVAEPEPVGTIARADRPTVELGHPDGASDRDYRLSNCHGFTVEADDHAIGIVEGVRYGSSTSRPDLIEVRAGRLGRRLVLVSVEDVEDVIEEEETLLLRPTQQAARDPVHALLARLRERIGHQVAT